MRWKESSDASLGVVILFQPSLKALSFWGELWDALFLSVLMHIQRTSYWTYWIVHVLLYDFETIVSRESLSKGPWTPLASLLPINCSLAKIQCGCSVWHLELNGEIWVQILTQLLLWLLGDSVFLSPAHFKDCCKDNMTNLIPWASWRSCWSDFSFSDKCI